MTNLTYKEVQKHGAQWRPSRRVTDNTHNQTLLYDELNRLTYATSNYGNIDYTYDAIGNRLTETVDTVAETYNYDLNTHHLQQTQNGGTTNYSYDANGNTTSNTDREFSYGDNNRLKEVSISGSPLATYTYNGRGERVKKEGIGITYYHYDQSGQLIEETNFAGNTTKEYLYVDGQPIAMTDFGFIHYIHTDHLGTPQQITNAAQAIVWKADYTPFGEATVTIGTITNNLRFPGQYFDEETNLHYNYFRYYDPSIGRYITSDPIGLDGGMNTYSYVMGDPISKYDAYGLYWIFIGWKQEWENNWWTHWRWTIAICKDTCSQETKDVYALYEQWRPIPIKTNTPSSPGSGSATGSLFDLIEAIGNARNYGGIGKGDYYYEKTWKEEGQIFCDTLN